MTTFSHLLCFLNKACNFSFLLSDIKCGFSYFIACRQISHDLLVIFSFFVYFFWSTGFKPSKFYFSWTGSLSICAAFRRSHVDVVVSFYFFFQIFTIFFFLQNILFKLRMNIFVTADSLYSSFFSSLFDSLKTQYFNRPSLLKELL